MISPPVSLLHVISLHLHNKPIKGVPLFLLIMKKWRLREVKKLPKDPHAAGTTLEVKAEPAQYVVMLILDGWMGNGCIHTCVGGRWMDDG